MSERVELISGLAGDFIAVTPSDSTVLNAAGLYVGTAGDVSVRGARNVTVVFKSVPSGTFMPIVANRVMAATTAADIVALVPYAV